MYVQSSVSLRHGTARPLLAGAPLDRNPAARTCGQDGCHTRLSRYNPSAVCAEHAGWQDTLKRRSRSAPVD